ncbi:hypothetical protein GE21DRAFT_1742 [Neurospora crassa]|nr:hypothetical protein GE21DRAFT_1742 [Neurospora crassa]
MAWWDSSRRSLGASLRSKKQHPPVVEPPAPAPAGPHPKPRHIDTHTATPHLTMELERALLSPITEEQPAVATQAETTNTGPLVVHVHIQFHDQDLHSVTHNQTYVSSPYFEPTGRICNGLLRRIEHCSEELITRTDPTALDMVKEGSHDRKPLRFELTYRVTRAGWMGEWAVRTYRSYQQRPLTAASAKEVIIASHQTVGMFFRRHDSDFRWLGGSVLDATPETADSSLDSEVGQMSLGAIPSPRFVEESQTFEFVPGYSIEVSLRHRNPRRLIPAFKRAVKVYSRQATPLTAEMGRDLLANAAEAINRSLGPRRQRLEIHAQQCTTMTCQHRDSTALNIDVRISNGMGPAHNSLQRSIRSSLSLFHDSHGEDFVRDVEESLADVTQVIDAQINQTNDFEFTICELKGVNWSVQVPAAFTVGASASHGRRDIQAVLDRIQTSIGDVLQGHNTAVRVNARKRGHLVYKEVIQTHEIPGRLKETFQSHEEEGSVLMYRLKERIQKDIDMIFKDTCSIDDIALEEEERHPRPIEVPLSPGLSVEWPERHNGPSLEFPPLSAKTSTERVNDNPISFVKRAFSLKRRSTSSLRQSLRSIASSRSSLNSQDDSYSVNIPHVPEAPARPVSPTPATSTKSSKKRFSLGKKISNMFKSKDSKSDLKSDVKTDIKSESSSRRRFFRSSSSKSTNAVPVAPVEPKLMRAHTATEAGGGRTLHRPTRSMTSNPLGSYDATHSARGSFEHPRPFQAATPNLANGHGIASKIFETYPQPTEPRWSIDRLERPVMDTPQLYEDAKEFPHQLLTPGLTTRSTDTPNPFHWLASPGADAYSTAPSTPALSLGGESSPRHSLLISPIHVRHLELKDNTSSDFEPESEPEEAEVGTGVTTVGASVAAGMEVLKPSEDDVRSVVLTPKDHTIQPEQLAEGFDEEAVKSVSYDATATAISIKDTTTAPSDLHKTESELTALDETLAPENRELRTEPAPLSNETLSKESDFPKPAIRPLQPSHETTVFVDARNANSETKSASDKGTEVQNAPVVQNENRVIATETDYFKDFESVAESKPIADIIGSDIDASEVNDATVSLVDNPADDLNGLIAEPAITQSGPEGDKAEYQHDQECDTRVSDVDDVPPTSTEEVAHDIQPTVKAFQPSPEDQTAEPDNYEADIVASEIRHEPPSMDEVTQDCNNTVPEDESVDAPSRDETSPLAELAAQEPKPAQSSPEADVAGTGEDGAKLPTEDLDQNGSADFFGDVSEPSVADHTTFEVSGEPMEARETIIQTDTSSEGSVSEHDKEWSELAEGDSISPAGSKTLVEDQDETDMINTFASLHISYTDKATGASTKEHPGSNNQDVSGSALVAHVEIHKSETREPSGLELKDVENTFGPEPVPVESKEDVLSDNDTIEITDETPNSLRQPDWVFEETDRPHSWVDTNLLQPSEALDSRSDAINVSESPELTAESPDIQDHDHTHIPPETPLPLEEAPGAQESEATFSKVGKADESVPVAVATVKWTPDVEEDYELSFGTVETAANIDSVEAVDDVQHVEHVEDVGTTFEAPDFQEDEKVEINATNSDVAAQYVRSFEERGRPFVSTSDVVERGHVSDEVYDNRDAGVVEKPHFDDSDTEHREPTITQFWPDPSSVFIPFAPKEVLGNDTELFHPDSMSTMDSTILGVETAEHCDPTLPQFRSSDVLEIACRSYAVSGDTEEGFEVFKPTEAVSARVEEKANYRDPTMPQFRPHVLLQPTPTPLVLHVQMTEDNIVSQQPMEASKEEIPHRGKDETEYRDPTMPQYRPNSFRSVCSPSVSIMMAETAGYGEKPVPILIDAALIETTKFSEGDLDCCDPTMPQFRPNSILDSTPISSVSDEPVHEQREQPDIPTEDDSSETSSRDNLSAEYHDPTMPQFKPNWDGPELPHLGQAGAEQPTEQSAEYHDPTMPQFKPNWDGPELPHLDQAGAEQPRQQNAELTNLEPVENEKDDDTAAEVNAENTQSLRQLNDSTQPERVGTEAPDTEEVRDMQAESLESDNARDRMPEAKFVEAESPEHIQPDNVPVTESVGETHSETEDEEAEFDSSEPLSQPATEQSQGTQAEELPQDQFDTLFVPVDPKPATELGTIETGANELAESDSESSSQSSSESGSERTPTPWGEELYHDQHDALFEPREGCIHHVAAHDAVLKLSGVSKLDQVEYRDPTMPQFRPNIFLPYRDPTMPQFRPNAVMIISPITVPETVQESAEELDTDYIIDRAMDVLDQLESEERAGLNEEFVDQVIDLCEQVLEQSSAEAEETEDPLEQFEANNALEQIEAETEQTERLLEELNNEQLGRTMELFEEAITGQALKETDNALDEIAAEAVQTEELLKELDTAQTERVLEIAQDLEIQHSLDESGKTLEQPAIEVECTEELLEKVNAEQTKRAEELVDQLETEKENEQNQASLKEINAEIEKTETLLQGLDLRQHERAEEIPQQQGSQQDVTLTAADKTTEKPINSPVAGQAVDVPESFLDEFPEDKEQPHPSAVLPAEAAIAEAAAGVPLASHRFVSRPPTLGYAEIGTAEMQDTPQQPTVAVIDKAPIGESSITPNVQLEYPGIELANLEDEGLEDADVASDVPSVEPTTGPVIVNCETWIEHTDIGNIALETPASVVQRAAEATSSHEPIVQEAHPEFPNIEHANLEDEGLEDSELPADIASAEPAAAPVVINCDTWIEHADVEDAGVQVQVPRVASSGEETTMEPILIPVQSSYGEILAEKSCTPLAEPTPISECIATPYLEDMAVTESQSEQETSTNEPMIVSDINEDEPLACQVSHEQGADFEEQDTPSEVVDRSLGNAPGTEDTDDSTGDVDTTNADGSLRVESLDNLIRSAEAIENKLREPPEVESATGEDEKAGGEEVIPAMDPVEEPLSLELEANIEETGDFDKTPLAIPSGKDEDVIVEQEMLQDIPAAALPDLCLLEEIVTNQPISAPAIPFITQEILEPAQQLSDISNPRQVFRVSPRGSVDTIRGSDVDEEEAPELYAPPPTAGFFGFHHYHENKWAKVGLFEVLINSTSRRFSLPLQSLLHRKHRSDACP